MGMALILAGLAAAPLAESYAADVTGSFTSAAQHAADPRYDIAEVHIVRIWPERTDAVWLYQEQAIVNQPGLTPAQARAKPYFQFVARIVPLADGTLRRDNFRVRDGAAWAGIRSTDDARLARLGEGDLHPASCHNLVEKVGAGHWTGRTESCANGYKGASYMRSLSVATPDRYVNWDRGFDAEGKRLWGPAEGGYIFLRAKD